MFSSSLDTQDISVFPFKKKISNNKEITSDPKRKLPRASDQCAYRDFEKR